jgi:hexosaminidase
VIIPALLDCVRHAGDFPLTPAQRIYASPGAGAAADLLAEYLGILGAERIAAEHSATIRLDLGPGPEPQGYELRITPDQVLLSASELAGLFNGVQTLRQLVPLDQADRRWPCLTIRDAPRLAWRGVMLDAARHFMPLEFLYELVDEIALHKFNILHLHLTDDQGWRLEIDGLPRLTDVGAWRSESMIGPSGSTSFDGIRHGGYYTQAEMRALVAYAAARGITIVPEIGMPGHARAAIAAYPALGNSPERQLTVWTSWGICADVFAVHDGALEFCQEVLGQTAQVFPSAHLHLGGDECPSIQWETSPDARGRARELGLEHPRLLHSWFLGRMNEFVKELGRTAVCWDETGQSGGTMPDGMVLAAWREAEHGANAIAAGRQVLMTPHTPTYLDYRQTEGEDEPQGEPGYTVTLADVYRFDPLAGGLPPIAPGSARPGVLGTQAHLWTAFVPDPDHARYLLYPRLCAMAETAWSGAGRDYTEFQHRLKDHLARLRQMGALRDKPHALQPSQRVARQHARN